MKPFYERDGITIYHGDCLEVMPCLPEGGVDLVVTDPPWMVGVTSHGNQQRPQDGNMLRPFLRLWWEGVRRLLKDGGEGYVHIDWRTYPLWYPVACDFVRMRNLLVWDYEWKKGGNFYRFSHELIMFFTSGDARRRFSAAERDVWREKPINWTSPKKLHQAQKPLALTERMIGNSSREGELVLDTFFGSGTVLLAAKRLGRRAIGVEIDEAYCELAAKRLESEEGFSDEAR